MNQSRNTTETTIIRIVAILNVVFLAVILLATVSPLLALGPLAVAFLYLCVICTLRPQFGFFAVIGCKFVFDGLWIVELPGFDGIRATHLFFIPMVLLVFSLVPLHRRAASLLALISIYLIWLILAPLANAEAINVEVSIRHAIPLFAIIFASKFVKDRQSVDLLVLVLAIGTVIPLAVVLVQYGFQQIGVDILFSKTGAIRGSRISGLYYDPATSGSVALIALVASTFILLKEELPRWRRLVLPYSLFALSMLTVLVGRTRSMIGITLFIFVSLIIFGLSTKRRFRRIMPLTVIALLIALVFLPSIESVITRSKVDSNITEVSLEEALTDRGRRTLFTGRAGLWQDVLEEVRASSSMQKLLGTGKNSNAHSTYFFLLLKIGFAGLLFYMFIHLMIVWKIIGRSRQPIITKLTGVLAIAALLALGISANVTMYTTYQIVLYMIAASALFLPETESVLRPTGPFRKVSSNV